MSFKGLIHELLEVPSRIPRTRRYPGQYPQSNCSTVINNPFVHLWPLLLIAALMLCEPALANKFETIGSGVSGSFRVKKEFLQIAFLITGGGFLFAAVLAVILPHTNAAFLNYRNWKASAIVLGVIGGALLSGYLFV